MYCSFWIKLLSISLYESRKGTVWNTSKRHLCAWWKVEIPPSPINSVSNTSVTKILALPSISSPIGKKIKFPTSKCELLNSFIAELQPGFKSVEQERQVLSMLQLYMEYTWLIKQWRIYDFPEGDANLPAGGGGGRYLIIWHNFWSKLHVKHQILVTAKLNSSCKYNSRVKKGLFCSWKTTGVLVGGRRLRYSHWERHS